MKYKIFRDKIWEAYDRFILEAKTKTSVDSELLGHLTHAKDLPHELPGPGSHHGVDLIHQFHNLRMGKPSSVRAQLKVDGGASVVIGHDSKGVFVSDKHRHTRGVVARTPEEVDQHFGHSPDYAASLKNVLEHGHKFVNKGHTIQGDLLFTEHDKKAAETKVKATPNRIQYGINSKAKIGLAAHTEITNGVAHEISSKALSHHSDVFTPQSEYKPEPSTYNKKDREATENHLNAAKALMDKTPSTNHLTDAHQKHFTSYMNSTTRTNTKASVDGYKKFLSDVGKKESDKLKTDAGKQKKLSEFKGLSDHVDTHKDAFENTLNINHHLGAATEHVLKGIQHPDMETHIDGKASPGEGIALLKKDSEGRSRPVGKLVPKTVSHAILNNPRFGRG